MKHIINIWLAIAVMLNCNLNAKYICENDCIVIENYKYIAAVNFFGYWYAGTKKGESPLVIDDERDLLSNQMDSFLTLSINNTYYKMNMPVYNKKVENKIVTKYKIKKIEIDREISFVKIGIRRDAIKFSCGIKNTDTKVNHIGVRVLLNTVLGSKDECGFTVPYYGLIKKETFFSAKEVPDIICNIESISKNIGGINLCFNIPGQRLTKPDKIVLANPKIFNSNGDLWEGTFQPNREFRQSKMSPIDTGAIMYWNSYPFKAGQKLYLRFIIMQYEPHYLNLDNLNISYSYYKVKNNYNIIVSAEATERCKNISDLEIIVSGNNIINITSSTCVIKNLTTFPEPEVKSVFFRVKLKEKKPSRFSILFNGKSENPVYYRIDKILQ